MSGIETAALVASIVSVILAGVAIWLSFQFYRLTTQQSEKVEAAAAGIQSSVVKLDEVFQLLYRDAFAEVKANAEWHRNNQQGGSSVDTAELEKRIQAKADEAATEVSGKLAEQVAGMLEKQKGQSSDLKQLEGRIGSMTKEAIASLRAADAKARSQSVKKTILDAIQAISEGAGGSMVSVENLRAYTGISTISLEKHLIRLRQDGEIAAMPPARPFSLRGEENVLNRHYRPFPSSDTAGFSLDTMLVINPEGPTQRGKVASQTEPSGDP